MIFDSRSSNSTLIHQLYYSALTGLKSQTFSIRLNNKSRVRTPLCRYLETTNRPKLQCATNEYADPLINKLEEIFFLYPTVFHLFGMAALPFPCNTILLIQVNLPRIFPMSTLRYASFPIPYFKLF